MSIAQGHFLFHTADGRAMKLLLPDSVWAGEADHALAGWIVNEMAQEDIGEEELEVDRLARDLALDLEEHRPEWEELQELHGLATRHGMGEPAKLMRAKAPEERDWLVPGLVARASVTLIGGREKLSGKSTLVFSLIGSLERREETIFGPAYSEPVKSLIITEEPEYAIVDKLNRFDLNDAWVVQDWAWPLDRVEGYSTQERWVNKLVQVEQLAFALGAAHVVIDPLSRIAAVEEEAGRELGMRAEAVSSFAYRSKLAVTLVHHMNKRSDAASEDRFRGSTSLTAAVDQMVSIERRGRKKASARIRHAVSYGRVAESNWEKAWELEPDDVTYRSVHAEAEAMSEEAADLLVLRSMEGGRATIGQFCEALALDPEVGAEYQKAGRKLRSLFEAGLVERDGRTWIAKEAE